MNDINVTLVGNVTAEPRQHTLTDGSRVTSLRVVTTSRYYDKRNQEWRDGDKTYFAVRCWRGLGDNVAQSIRVGHPVVVQGRLRIREFEREGERRFIAEVEATSVGHDLRWGVGSFSRPQRGGAAPGALDAETRNSLDEATEDWSFTTASRSTAPAAPAWPALTQPVPTPALPPGVPAPVLVPVPALRAGEEAMAADTTDAGPPAATAGVGQPTNGVAQTTNGDGGARGQQDPSGQGGSGAAGRDDGGAAGRVHHGAGGQDEASGPAVQVPNARWRRRTARSDKTESASGAAEASTSPDEERAAA